MTEEAERGHSDAMMGSMSPDFGRDPQPTYAEMRSASPLRIEGAGVIVATRRDVDEVLRHPELFSSAMPVGRLGNVRPLIPIEIDPPNQKKFRKLLDPLFAPKRVKLLEASVEKMVNELIDGLDGAAEIDFVTQFSIPFPSQVFLTLLGLPLEELPRFLGWKDGIIRPFHVLDKPQNNPEVIAYQAEIGSQIYAYFNAELDKRELLSDRPDDLLTHFLEVEVEGDRMSREEILDLCFLFIIAGLDTVSSSLETFFVFLATHPKARAELVADPSKVPAFVEELLRSETPVMLVSRQATQDAEVHGCPIKRDEKVFIFLGAANTDEAEFPDATEFRWDREANRHIAFGGGIHRCLGSHLARLELRTALRVWHDRIPHYRITPGAEVDFTFGVRSADTFPMQLGVSA
jgi:cytochrome P450